MSVSYALRSHYRKLVKFGSIFKLGFNPSRCKTKARMTMSRIKLLRNKRETIVRQMRRDVALLLQSGQHATARIRVEHVIREQNMMAANEILELFCERIVTRLPIISKQRGCPTDLKEAISSLLFAGPRCSDIPELLAIRDIFQKKYGKDFVSAATDLRPDSGVNRLLIEKLSALNPPGELKLKVMKEIAKEYQIEWDPSETEAELLEPLEERIEGPRTFVSAGTLPLNPGVTPSLDESQKPKIRPSVGGGNERTFQNAVSAAEAAANSAKEAVAAAEAAAQLAKSGNYNNLGLHSMNNRSHSLGGANNCSKDTDMDLDDDMNYIQRRHSYNVPRADTDIKFDESDCDEDMELEQQPPSYVKTGNASSVHPKLPDYDALSVRFEALKYRKA